MKIPNNKKHFYSEQHLKLRANRERLRVALVGPSLESLCELESELVKEAIETIAKKGKEISITHNKKVYDQDLEKMKNGDENLYILCDKEGNLKDLTSLLAFVSPETREKYETLRNNYLSCQ